MTNNKTIKFLHKLLFRLNMLAALMLLVTYTTPYISPQTFWPMAILGLAYPILLGINILFLIYWSLHKKILYVIFSILIILCGFPLLERTIGTVGEPAPLDSTKVGIKVLSYNVKNFDLYNWNKNIEARNQMMALIREENPDVVCFQEFFTKDDDEKGFDNVKWMQEQLGYPHYHFHKSLTVREREHFGVALFSKYPLSNQNHIVIDGSQANTIIYADVSVDNKTFRLFNAHLQSIHLGRSDLRYMKELGGSEKSKEKKTAEDHWKYSKSIVNKLKNAFVKRSKQAKQLHEYIKTSPHPVVVVGDFNDTPTSYTYKVISQGLKDAFLNAGIGLGVTYAGPLPALRIDYILYDPALGAREFKIINKELSDHFPISCIVSL